MAELTLSLQYNKETGKWEEHKEPFATIECPTEEDYNRLMEMIDFWHLYHKEERDSNG